MAASESTVDALESAGICCARLFDEVPCWISIQDRQFRVIEENRKLHPCGSRAQTTQKQRSSTRPVPRFTRKMKTMITVRASCNDRSHNRKRDYRS